MKRQRVRERLSPEAIELLAASDNLTYCIREHMAALLEKRKVGRIVVTDRVFEELQSWADWQLIENLAEWTTKEGINYLTPECRSKIELRIVRAAKASAFSKKISWDSLLSMLNKREWVLLLQLNVSPGNKRLDWLGLLTGYYLENQLKELKAKPRGYRPLEVPGTGHVFAPKYAAGAAWACGTHGVEHREVKIDDDAYADCPNVATALVPRSYALLQRSKYKRPHQMTFPFQLADEDPIFAVAVADSTTKAVIPPIAFKVAMLIMTDSSAPSEEVKGFTLTLRELTKEVYPGKRFDGEKCKLVASSLNRLRNLVMYLPNQYEIQCFEVHKPGGSNPDPDQPVFMGLTRGLSAIIGKAFLERGSPYSGKFLVNKSGIMSLPGNRKALPGILVRIYAHWNAAYNPKTGLFDPEFMPRYTLEQWAALCNCLSPLSVELIRSQGEGYPEKVLKSMESMRSQDIKEVRRGLEYLQDEKNLISLVNWKKKMRYKDEVIIHPVESYLEAQRTALKMQEVKHDA